MLLGCEDGIDGHAGMPTQNRDRSREANERSSLIGSLSLLSRGSISGRVMRGDDGRTQIDPYLSF
jgi:hypothetical protein